MEIMGTMERTSTGMKEREERERKRERQREREKERDKGKERNRQTNSKTVRKNFDKLGSLQWITILVT